MAVRARVRLEYFIELDVEANNEDDIYDWMATNTPQGVFDDMYKQGKFNQVYEGFDEHIVEWIDDDDAEIDLVISEE